MSYTYDDYFINLINKLTCESSIQLNDLHFTIYKMLFMLSSYENDEHEQKSL